MGCGVPGERPARSAAHPAAPAAPAAGAPAGRVRGDDSMRLKLSHRLLTPHILWAGKHFQYTLRPSRAYIAAAVGDAGRIPPGAP